MRHLSRRNALRLGITGATLAATTRPLMANMRPMPAPPLYPVVETTAGKLRGAWDGYVTSFRGVPYAWQPVRFRAPAPFPPWTGVREALTWGPQCPQDSNTGTGLLASYKTPGPMDENCLTLNIWTPEATASRKRPVMVWLHGGGFEGGGSGSANWYDGTRLASRGDVVVVTITHRLNVFGYLYLGDLGDLGGAGIGADANVGQRDIIAALQWIQDTIEVFGGDPACVTLFGASGGGKKIGTLMAMPEAKGLFHRAIVQSGATLRAATREEATQSAGAFLKQLGLAPGDAAKLATIPAPTLVAAREALFATPAVSFGPVIDDASLPAHPFDPVAPAQSAAIPLLIGTAGAETTLLLPDEENFHLDEPTLRAKLASFGPPARVEALIEAARAEEPDATASDIFFQITSDARSRLRAIAQAERKAAQPAPVYMYVTEWRTPVDGGKWRSPHVGDLPLVFDNIDLAPSMVGTGEDARMMAATMSSSWIAFARSGDPSTPQLPHWPRYDTATRATMRFDTQSRIVNDPHARLRALLSS